MSVANCDDGDSGAGQMIDRKSIGDPRELVISRVRVIEGTDMSPPIIEDCIEVYSFGVLAGRLQVSAGLGERVARWLMSNADIVEICR